MQALRYPESGDGEPVDCTVVRARREGMEARVGPDRSRSEWFNFPGVQNHHFDSPRSSRFVRLFGVCFSLVWEIRYLGQESMK